MKKIILILLMFIASASFYLQAQTAYGFKVGVGLAKMKFDTPDSSVNSKNTAAFHIGAVLDLCITPDFYIQPQLLISRKGTKLDLSSSGFGSLFVIKTSMSPTYIELPVNLVYKHNFEYGRILLGAGPYIAYGIGGKIKVNMEFAGSSKDTTYTIKWGKSLTDDMVPLDYGASFMAGYEIYNFQFTLNYSRGFASMIPENDEKIKAMNRVFSVSAAYIFRKKGQK